MIRAVIFALSTPFKRSFTVHPHKYAECMQQTTKTEVKRGKTRAWRTINVRPNNMNIALITEKKTKSGNPLQIALKKVNKGVTNHAYICWS